MTKRPPNNKFGKPTKFLIGRLIPKATRAQEYHRCACTCKKEK